MLNQTRARLASNLYPRRSIWRRHPIVMTLFAGSFAFAMGTWGYVNWHYAHKIDPLTSPYPPDVGAKLRRALYFTEEDYDYRKGLRFWREAYTLAVEKHGMDPLSNEVLGIVFRLADFLQSEGHTQPAIDLLWAAIHRSWRYLESLGQTPVKDLDPETRRKRLGVLESEILMLVALARLEHGTVSKDANSISGTTGRGLSLAIAQATREYNRRRNEGVLEGEEDPEVLGGNLSDFFEAATRHSEAFGVYSSALATLTAAAALHDPQSCHYATILNNISVCVAHLSPADDYTAFRDMLTKELSLPAQTAGDEEDMPARKDPHFVFKEASRWSRKALAAIEDIPIDSRDSECALCSAAANVSLGEFSEQMGQLTQARDHYKQAKALAKAVPADKVQGTTLEISRRMFGYDEDKTARELMAEEEGIWNSIPSWVPFFGRKRFKDRGYIPDAEQAIRLCDENLKRVRLKMRDEKRRAT